MIIRIDLRPCWYVAFCALWGWSVGDAHGHGDPVTLFAQHTQLVVNLDEQGIPLFETGELDRLAQFGLIAGDRPGIEIARATDGIAAGTSLGLNVVSSLYYWDGVAVSPSTVELEIYGPDSAEFYVVKGDSAPQQGLAWETYTGSPGWHSHGLFSLDFSAPAGMYGLLAQITATGYAPTEPFLMTWLYDPSLEFADLKQDGVYALHAFLQSTPDLNADGTVDASDAGILFSQWGGTGQGDLNQDLIVDAADAGIMFAAWTGDADAPSVAMRADSIKSHSLPEPSNWLMGLGFVAPLWTAFRQRRNAAKCPGNGTMDVVPPLTFPIFQQPIDNIFPRNFTMKKLFLLLASAMSLMTTTIASAHGPQIQLTVDNNKISTREIMLDSPYDTLTAPKSVYVMPLLDFNGAWYSRPNGKLNALSIPEFYSGPGFAYGYDQHDGGPQDFAEGSTLSLLVGELKKWSGSDFANAGATEAQAFRGSNTSPTATATSVDVGSSSLSFATVAAGYGADGPEAHATVRYRMLGDGVSPSVAPSDGIYLLSMGLSSTQTSLTAADPFYFVLYKNSSQSEVEAAVGKLGHAPGMVQYVPEPIVGSHALGLALLAAIKVRPRRQG